MPQCMTNDPLVMGFWYWFEHRSDAVNALWSAAYRGDLNKARTLIQKGVDVNSRGRYRTPLFEAVEQSHAPMVELLLSSGAKVNVRDEDGNTPLSESYHVDAEIVRRLLAEGAKVNVADDSGSTPLHKAADYGNEAAVEMLLARGARMNVKDNAGWTPIHYVESQQLKKLLLARGARIENIFDAAHAGDLAKIRTELDKASNLINKASDEGWTPLQYAARADNLAAAELLIKRGAEVNVRDIDDKAPLHNASSGKMVSLLLSHGASMDTKGYTPLHSAAHQGHADKARVLIAEGAAVNARNGINNTPLHLAAQYDRKEVAEILIKAGADVNSRGKNRQTPLHYAALYGEKRVVTELLVSHGVGVDARDDDGMTALGYAEHWGHIGIAAVLRGEGKSRVSDERDK